MINERVSRPPASGSHSVELQTLRGQTPLFLAVEHGLIENASFLLQHGAQPDTQNHDQDSPLFVGKLTNITPLQDLLSSSGQRGDFPVFLCSLF